MFVKTNSKYGRKFLLFIEQMVKSKLHITLILYTYLSWQYYWFFPKETILTALEIAKKEVQKEVDQNCWRLEHLKVFSGQAWIMRTIW